MLHILRVKPNGELVARDKSTLLFSLFVKERVDMLTKMSKSKWCNVGTRLWMLDKTKLFSVRNMPFSNARGDTSKKS